LKGINKIINRAILFIVLLLPVFLFLFLKYCGVNHYAVAVYYQNGVHKIDTACDFPQGPYRVNNFLFRDLKGQFTDTTFLRGKYSILSVSDALSAKNHMKFNANVKRVLNNFHASSALQAITVYPNDLPDSVIEKNLTAGEGILYLKGSPDDVSHFARCGLILPADSLYSEWVLVDPAGRIRGYYPADRFDEYDRMIVEIKILLKEEYRRP